MARGLVLPRRRRVAALAALVLASGCLHDVYRSPTVAAPPPPRPPPPTPSTVAAAAPAPPVRILVFGDFGYDTPQQHVVAWQIRRQSEADPFDLAIQLGDNIYKCGPDPLRPGADTCRFEADGTTVAPGATPPDDPLFLMNERPLEGLVARGGGALPMFLALGNHDVGWGGGRCAAPGLSDDEAARRRACLAVARRTPTWTMPGRHYVVDRGPVRLVVVDTNVAVADYGGFTLEDEIAFVRRATAGCGEGRHCFIVGHHPPAAVHGYGRGKAPPYGARLGRLVAAAGGRARAWLAGHVHALEHLSLGNLDVFVSGSTAMGGVGGFRWVWPRSAQVRLATSAWGFAVLEVDAAGYSVRFVDSGGEDLHCCVAGAEGPCRPAECGGRALRAGASGRGAE